MNSFQHDTRVLKACRVATQTSPERAVLVAALGDTGLPVDEKIGDRLTVWRPQLRSRSWPRNLFVQVFKYIEWLWTIVKRSRTERPDLVHVHSLSALPVGVAVKCVTGAPVLYDAHELETEIVGIGAVERGLSRWAERLLIRRVDGIVTVCDSIADWYVERYSVDRPSVVRNIPAWSTDTPVESHILREVHRIPDGELIFLYQGALSPGRGIERLLEVFGMAAPGKHLVLMGYGVLESRILESASRSDSIHYQPAVPPDEVLHYTASADVGLCLIEAVCLSNYYCLPNKLFEYLKSGLPLIVSDLPEQREIVEKYECGWVAADTDGAMEHLIDSIDRRSMEATKAGVRTASQVFSWPAEAEVLKEAYSAIERSRDASDSSGHI